MGSGKITKSFFAGFLIIVCMLAGCTRQASSASLKSARGVSVSIHGVTYTADPFEFVVIDPNDPSNSGGGEHIGPFSAGGIVCCFTLPKSWSAGLKVEVHTTYWLPENEKGELREISKTYKVEVPPYANGKASELWVLRTASGGIELVSTNLQPDHSQWPGKVKGWPVPTRAYMLERWKLYFENAEHTVHVFRKAVVELNKEPKSRLYEAWEFAKDHNSEELNKFSGPDDPAYEQFIKKEYAERLRDAEAQLKQLLEEKP